jgi:hypothetical protein
LREKQDGKGNEDNTEYSSSVSGESSGNEESEDENMDWRKCAIKLEEENEMLRRQLLAKDVKVAALKAKVEGIRVDVIP